MKLIESDVRLKTVNKSSIEIAFISKEKNSRKSYRTPENLLFT